MLTRRRLLESTTAAAAGAALASRALASPRAPLIENVAAVCRRLAGAGWRALLLKVSDGQLDITASDLRAELGKELGRIDRSVAGFSEFAPEGRRAVEPGRPAASLLYHAFASADVQFDGFGSELAAFPTLAEIEAVEDYVYGAAPPSLGELRERAQGHPLAIVVFSLEYRRAAESPHGRHADLAFSRIGIARTGTAPWRYDERTRSFDPLDPAQPHQFRAIPQRFAAYVAARMPADRARSIPRDFLRGDEDRQFWVPLQKLFAGPDCIAGLDLEVDLRRHLINEKLRRFHRYLEIEGLPSTWTGEDLDRFPFVIQDEAIASFSSRTEAGRHLLEPRPSPLAVRARYKGEWLTFEVPSGFVQRPGVMYFSTAQILPGEVERAPTYMHGVGPDTDRPAPEYVSIRHRVGPDGTLENLNRRPDMMSILRRGGYHAQHFIDFAGDGWIEARIPQLAAELPARLPAYCLVAPPDFFPYVSQRDLSVWWRREVAPALRAALWAVPPTSLSERRIAPNINLRAGFSIHDTTVTALVSHPVEPAPEGGTQAAASTNRYSGLPDASPGVFDPGWDASLGQRFGDPETHQPYLQSYGLGTPFVEDVKLCAALGSYWPAVAPDSSRSFSPNRRGPGFAYPWPTIVPLTDIEIGSAPDAQGGFMPWDGVRGPRLETAEGRERVIYPDIDRVDYLTNLDRMTAVHLAKVDLPETQARVLAMAAVYWALGLRDPETPDGEQPEAQAVIAAVQAKAGWAVLSFRAVDGADPELAAAEKATSSRLTGERRYRFHVYVPGLESRHPTELDLVVVELKEQAVAYVGPGQVLMRRDGGPWRRDTSMPTS